MLQSRNKNKLGFTLLELLVVIAVIGILSTMIYASLSQSRTKARDSKRIATINQLRKALDMYLSDRGYYPTSLDDLFNSGYISAIPEDRIGNQGDKSICSAEVRRYPPYNEKGYCYGYAPSSNPTYYHLGVDLELDNPVLDADANKEDLGDVKNGFDAKYPGREMIYDVVP